ncbi:MAG: D-alanyl-D-alanine carboxypeptidase/D-alanyl-D-alanine-endopeptidase [Moorea sp. SIO3I7]|uniref:D-alanyl-D-alanine carboxypeptidase/D-alanyl-D-alanine-endopeptidase n=1 Tax=Moorena bouillonii PNG TaxID=568701 RepID=A0A1U7N4G6_9CYAN|nr:MULTISPECIES: D-alanyl-D-alanine carboxypeptidase/D-alanyl-D-alanine-endopeptidase [Moorena]NEO00924.1 D-alanyl-D-alanine carboxypeptidase/D-alanyl-D-alanine-endopeptidase [Moorena sp. SIO3I7]NEO46971.1 D-alanyl-D-alanine carboxypeptidase/D-alanyl-D-alanine-endopeptidase [Moorena sp. SIO4A3]NEO62224.1 D-alanyl-D-alanine carboxypeptidase/D-alanyl-D-alanine-endopeptidase [Moorena sp. SIO4G2]NEO17303.1 D-alanyl-D-alanine carboxypeptidase/D-alanyl-D-alanine-endopeptidase [Moorena sp. SIO3E8]NEQ
MTQLNYWLKSLGMLTVAVLTTVSPITSRKANARTVADLRQEGKSLEISVLPPETAPTDSIKIPVPPPETNKNGICPEFLPPVIDSIIDHPSLARGKWGIVVESLSEEKVFYSHNANQYLIPASNIKLLTTAAALNKVHPNTPIRSKSMKEWVKITNLKSHNSYADTLLRYIGGSEAVQDALAELGVDPNSYRLVDGSGLSRKNLATPEAFITTLKGMSDANNNQVFLASLPVAGVSGTLKNRLRHPSTQTKVQAKTGTLRGVKALSGYLEHPDYGTIVFSIMVNQPSQSGKVLEKGIDQIVLRLTQLMPCNS